MKKVVLIFPNTLRILEFILEYKIAGVVTNSLEKSLTGILPDDKIVAACTQFEAYIQSSSPVRVSY